MKRLVSVTVGLVLGVSLWSGAAWAESGLMEGSTIVANEQSYDVQHAAGNPFTGVFSQARSTLNQVGFSSPLRVLLNTIAAQLDALEADLAQLYDDLFVATCPTCESD